LSKPVLWVRLACLALLIITACPAAARAEYSLIPLPVYGTSRNGGNDFGFMPVWLLKEQNEYVYAIIAPSVIYNENTGTNITFRYLGFPSIDENYRIFVNRSLGTDQEYTGEYWDNKFVDGRFRLFGRLTFFRDTTYRFFGLTEQSREIDETNYANMELSPQFSLGYYLPHNFVLSYGEKLRWVTIRRGTADSLPFIQSEHPKLEGINGGAVLERRLKLTYDTRDDEVFPTEGWYANLFGEVGHSFTHSRTYSRTGFDARTYISFSDKRFITVLKGEFQLTAGHKVPFFAESTLGGENTLRGFGNYRFRDDGFILLNVEERIRLFKLHIFGVWSEWEAAPFVDVGRVYSSFSKDFFNDYQINPGVGFRAIVQPNIVGRVDFGYGSEGLTAFVGLDFPF
jgi:outer membrane protein assembly factor BamA